MNKKILIFIISIIYFQQSYCDQSHEYNNFNNSRHHHSSHHHSHLSPEKQAIFNNYQKRLDTLYYNENNPSYTTRIFLTSTVAFVLMFIGGIYNQNSPATAGGMLGCGASLVAALVSGASGSTDGEHRQREIAEILEKMAKL